MFNEIGPNGAEVLARALHVSFIVPQRPKCETMYSKTCLIAATQI